MNSFATSSSARTLFAELWRRLQRERALIALFALGRQKNRGLRAARLYAFSVFVGYGLAVGLTHGSDQSVIIQGLIASALVPSSWVVGSLAALGATQALAQQADGDALAALAVQRGFSLASLRRARALSAARRIAQLVGLPALLLVLVGLVRGCSFAWALGVAPAVIVYALVLSSVLALLAVFSAEVAPHHPRALLTLLVLAPLLLSLAFPAIPSIPSGFSRLLSGLLGAEHRS